MAVSCSGRHCVRGVCRNPPDRTCRATTPTLLLSFGRYGAVILRPVGGSPACRRKVPRNRQLTGVDTLRAHHSKIGLTEYSL